MLCVKCEIVIFIAFALISNYEGRKVYDDSQNDEDDSLDCNDGRKIDDPILVPFFEKLREQEMIPSRMKEWIIYFDENDGFTRFGTEWNETYLTENGLSKDNQGLPFGRVLYTMGKNVYLPRLKPISDEWIEFRVLYAEQLLLDAMEKVKIYISYEPGKDFLPSLSNSATRILQKIMKRGNLRKIYVVTSSQCDNKCKRVRDNPLIKLATCGSAFGKTVTVECRDPMKDIFEESDSGRYKRVSQPEFQIDLPKKLKRELHKIMDWLLNRIAQRMRNYMEMAFAKNRFRKTPNDLYNKVNLQISKIRGGETFEASKSADLIYNSLFDLNVYLNVTNTPYTFDKFASFNRYLNFIGRFSKWHLDTTKYANFFEPLKEICQRYIGSGSLLMNPATKIFELEEGVYDLTGVICHDNVLYIINGLTTMNNIKSGLYDNGNCQFDTVFVLAKKNFTINENLRIPGKNLIIFSQSFYIVKKQTIDLSGEPGMEGEEGNDGGDFFAFGTKFEKSEFLTVVSNGGKGGPGKNAEEVSNPLFFSMNGVECIPVKTDEMATLYGATYGAPGGSAGSVTLKFIRNRIVNVTVIQNRGENGRNGLLKDLTVNCGRKNATVSVSTLKKGNFTKKKVQRMKEPQALELFRKIIRKNSRRLSYEVLTFYKDIWTSPLMGQTLDSTLRDFLNASDYTKDSREFYDITSQILHTQIKYSCNMTESRRVLLDFALTTIRMESPTEGVLPSVIDIDGYLKEVSERVGRNTISSEYFERKESKFRKVIEEANNYLNVSLLPSLKQTIESTQNYLQQYMTDSSVFEDVEHFEESLVMNTLLRHLATLFTHVHLSLDDFVTPLEGGNADGLNSDGLKRKLYFYRHVRNNMTANDMNAMREFLEMLKSTVEEEALYSADCTKEVNEILKKLQMRLSGVEECERIAENLKSELKNENNLRLGELTCRECNGNCIMCGWCRSCQLQCTFDGRFHWCEKSTMNQEGKHSTSECAECNNCYRCPSCKKCDEDPDRICESCGNCDFCPDCPMCSFIKDCSQCKNCSLCSHCPQCQSREETPCGRCSYCSLCPTCSKCNAFALIRNRPLFSRNHLCQRCPCSVCLSCPGCRLRPEFDEIDRDVFFGMSLWRNNPGKQQTDLFSRLLLVSDEQQRREQYRRFHDEHLNLRTVRQADSPLGIVTEPESSIEQHFPQDFHRGSDDAKHKCVSSIGSYLAELFKENLNGLNSKRKVPCSIALKSLQKIMPNGEFSMPSKPPIRLNCATCNDTLDYFLEKISSELKKCKGESNYNYKEVDSMCSPHEGVLFHMRGCDPEIFYRTYDEIRGNFLKEFSHFVDVGESKADEINLMPRNFKYLLTNVEMFLSEGIPLTEQTLNGVLHVTDSLVKYNDLKMEYEKRVTELHDFSETDVYDLFASELSMQNERLDVTSRWLSQLKKLTPWMKKVSAFLSKNLKFQEVNEKILEAMRLVSEIVHNVKIVEHYRHLREYMIGVKNMDKIRSEAVNKFKPVFQKTFVTDVFNKAVKMSENWMFPLTKSLTELRSTLRGLTNATYQSQLKAIAKEIENHRKAIPLYTSMQSLESKHNKTLLYKWNVRTRPTLLNDLFNRKPVILVSEILDGGKMNSLMANNFEIKLVAGRRQKEGTQMQIDAAIMGSTLNVTHSGISYFKFGSRIYRRLTETFTFSHSASPINRTGTLQKMDFVLSPYTTWILRFESDSEERRFPKEITDKIGTIELYGTARYVVNCAEIPEVNQQFTPLSDYRRRNGK